MTEPLFDIQALHVVFPDMARKPLIGAAPNIEVLKGVDVTVAKGEILGIVGGSGSGKSTLGRAMLRLVPAASGKIIFQGQDITDLNDEALRPLRRQMQIIFQDPMSSLNPRHTVHQIIAGPLAVHGFADKQDRVDKVLDDVGLGAGFAGRYPHELSGGQRQRVGIARAIALEPSFILADEIVSGLDVSSQAIVLNLLRDLVDRMNLTLAFVSHDLSVISALCSRVLVVHEGRVVEEGQTDDIFAAPKAEYTRRLIDAIPLPDPSQKF